MKRDEKRRPVRGRGGFTLVEILLVMVIIGMLVTLVTVSVPKTLERAKVNKAKTDIQGLGVAITAYYMNEGRYPPSLRSLTEGDDPYLQRAIPRDPWGGEYQYTYPGSRRAFRYDLQTVTPEGRIIANWNLDEREGTESGP